MADTAVRAEVVRLLENMHQLAQRNAWGGVERSYLAMGEVGGAIPGDAHALAGYAAANAGDIETAVLRLQRADESFWLFDGKGTLLTESAVKAERARLMEGYGPVEIAAKRKAVLAPIEPPFDPYARAAIEFAQISIDEDGSFEGYLPIGTYTLTKGGAGARFTVAPAARRGAPVVTSQGVAGPPPGGRVLVGRLSGSPSVGVGDLAVAPDLPGDQNFAAYTADEAAAARIYEAYSGYRHMTQDLSRAIVRTARNLGANPYALANLLRFESQFNPKAYNPYVGRNEPYGAVGLIQFIPSTAVGVGTTGKRLYYMSAVDQMPYVEAELAKYRPLNTTARLYLAVFRPASIDWPVDQTFPTSVLEGNPSMKTPRHYVDKANEFARLTDAGEIIESAPKYGWREDKFARPPWDPRTSPSVPSTSPVTALAPAARRVSEYLSDGDDDPEDSSSGVVVALGLITVAVAGAVALSAGRQIARGGR